MKYLLFFLLILDAKAFELKCANMDCDILYIGDPLPLEKSFQTVPRSYQRSYSTLSETITIGESELWRDQMLKAILNGALNSH